MMEDAYGIIPGAYSVAINKIRSIYLTKFNMYDPIFPVFSLT